jgi:hypothetical protein
VLIRDHGKYLRLDTQERLRKLAEWNRPVWWPILLIGTAVLVLVALGWRSLRRRERTNARGEVIA